jgi:hypothetical protein
MAPFFNPLPESPDLQLLPEGVRSDEELATIAAECEAAVLAVFVVTLPRAGAWPEAATALNAAPYGAYALDAANGVYVCLRGYDPEPATCAALLREALKKEIAAVIRWRRTQWRADPQTASESDGGQGGRAKSFRDDKNAPFPPSFGLHLRPFDIRPPAPVI